MKFNTIYEFLKFPSFQFQVQKVSDQTDKATWLLLSPSLFPSSPSSTPPPPPIPPVGRQPFPSVLALKWTKLLEGEGLAARGAEIEWKRENGLRI